MRSSTRARALLQVAAEQITKLEQRPDNPAKADVQREFHDALRKVREMAKPGRRALYDYDDGRAHLLPEGARLAAVETVARMCRADLDALDKAEKAIAAEEDRVIALLACYGQTEPPIETAVDAESVGGCRNPQVMVGESRCW